MDIWGGNIWAVKKAEVPLATASVVGAVGYPLGLTVGFVKGVILFQLGKSIVTLGTLIGNVNINKPELTLASMCLNECIAQIIAAILATDHRLKQDESQEPSSTSRNSR